MTERPPTGVVKANALVVRPEEKARLNMLLTTVTLGIYAWWNQPEINVANYLDAHIDWAESK